MIHKSSSPDVTIPDVTVPAFVLRHSERLADKPAIIDGPTGRTLTYGQLALAVRRVATALHRLGFRKGDVFAIYSHNVPEYAVVFNAVAMLGGIVTTANPLCTAAELTKQLKDCRARFLITAPPRVPPNWLKRTAGLGCAPGRKGFRAISLSFCQFSSSDP